MVHAVPQGACALGRCSVVFFGMALLMGVLAAPSFGAERPKTGLREPTPEQLAWMAQHFPRVAKVLPNRLALQRANAERLKRGLGRLSVNPQDLPEVGGELVFAAHAPASGGSGSTATVTVAAVDNSASPAFPPIASQGALSSCTAWATTYYQFTYENALASQSAASGGDGAVLRSPKWTYNTINGGADRGAYSSDAYNLLVKHGACSAAQFPYDGNFLAWCLDPSAWRAAVPLRLASQGTINNSNPDTLLADLKTQLANGHVLTFGTYVLSWSQTTIANSPYAGQLIASYMANTNSGCHAMTLVGYDDSIWCDINGNGVQEAAELGALKVANSWGSGDGNGGYRWIAYDAVRPVSAVPASASWPPASRSSLGVFQGYGAYTVTARAGYAPAVLAEFTVHCAIRSQVCVTLGLGNPGDSAPTTTWNPGALRNQGGAYAFDGSPVAIDGTFCLDFAGLNPDTGVAKRYFLRMADSRAGYPTTVKAYRLTDAAGSLLASCTQSLPVSLDATGVWLYIDYPPGNQPPAVIAAAASPNPVTGIACALSATATDDGGEPNLTYTWSAVAAPTGATVAFDPNATNAAKSASATFNRAGSYTLRVVAMDARGLAASRDLPVTVAATPTAIAVVPASSSIAVGAQQLLKATASDQFGLPLSTQPAFLWSADAGQSIDPYGVFTAEMATPEGAPACVTARALGLTGTAAITVTPPLNVPPTIASAPWASPSPVVGSATQVSVVASDADGPCALTCTWSVVTGPAAVAFSPNGTSDASASTATFTAPGTHTLMVTVYDGVSTVYDILAVAVSQTASRIAVAPSSASVKVGQTRQFTAEALDQFAAPLKVQPNFAWSVGGGGTINSTGLFAAGTKAGGPFTLTASSAALKGTATVSVVRK